MFSSIGIYLIWDFYVIITSWYVDTPYLCVLEISPFMLMSHDCEGCYIDFGPASWCIFLLSFILCWDRFDFCIMAWCLFWVWGSRLLYLLIWLFGCSSLCVCLWLHNDDLGFKFVFNLEPPTFLLLFWDHVRWSGLPCDDRDHER